MHRYSNSYFLILQATHVSTYASPIPGPRTPRFQSEEGCVRVCGGGGGMVGGEGREGEGRLIAEDSRRKELCPLPSPSPLPPPPFPPSHPPTPKNHHWRILEAKIRTWTFACIRNRVIWLTLKNRHLDQVRHGNGFRKCPHHQLIIKIKLSNSALRVTWMFDPFTAESDQLQI